MNVAWMHNRPIRRMMTMAADTAGGGEQGTLYDNEYHDSNLFGSVPGSGNDLAGYKSTNVFDVGGSAVKFVQGVQELSSEDTATAIKGMSHVLGATRVKMVGSSLDDWWDLATSPLTTAAEEAKDAASKARGVSSSLLSAKSMVGSFQRGLSYVGIFIGVIDTVCGVLHITNPIDELLRKPFGGDWDAMTASAEDWRSIASNLVVIQNGLIAAQQQVQTSWQGAAYARYSLCNDQISQLFDDAPNVCREIADGLDMLAKVAQKCFDYALSIVEELINLCLDIMKWAATGVGLVAVAVNHAFSISSLIQNGMDVINNLNDAVSSFSAVTETTSQLASQADSLALSLQRT